VASKTAVCLWALLLSAGARVQAPAPSGPAPSPKAPGASAPAQDAGGQNAGAQDSAAPQPLVPIGNEPHHRLVLQNNFVHVYGVSVPPLDATLMHRHDLPYLAISFGPSDLQNLVLGKPAARLILQDGQVVYSLGGFAHLLRTDSGMAFRNVTVELARPQGTARNICKPIVAGPLSCPARAGAGKKNTRESADDDIPYFETDEVRVDLISVTWGQDYVEETPKLNGLLVALSNANLDANLGNQHISFLHEGDVLWLPAGAHRKVVDFLGTRSSFLLVSFKDSGGGANP
jgi:hypothetical protein